MSSAVDCSKLRYASIAGWLIFAVAAVPAAVSLWSAASGVITGGYMSLYGKEQPAGIDAAPQLLAGMLLPATFLLFVGNARKVLIRRFCVGTLLVSAAVQLFVGTRGAAVTSLIAFAWLWESCIGRVRKAFIISGMLGALVLLPMIAAVRNMSGAERSSPAILIGAIGQIDNPCAALVHEMGGSMGTVAHTLELIPALRPFDMGTSYAYAVLAAFPNIFGGPVHPSAAHGTFAKWLVETVDPLGAAVGFGFGYSFIAEAYANFGWIGTPLVMLTLGAGIQLLTHWAERHPAAERHAATATMTSFLLLFARSESSSLIRPLLWYGVVPYITVCCVSAWCRRTTGIERKQLLDLNMRNAAYCGDSVIE